MRRHCPILLAVVLLASRLPGTAAAEPTRAARCAQRDLQLLTLIERHGEAQDVPAGELANATFAMMAARRACAAGRIDEALAIYDAIVIEPARPRRD